MTADNVLFQFVSNLNIDTKGGLHIKSQVQPHQARNLIGQETGDQYQATGLTGFTVNVLSNGKSVVDTFYNNFRVIGPGPRNNFLLHVNSHVAINANGELTVDAINVSETGK